VQVRSPVGSAPLSAVPETATWDADGDDYSPFEISMATSKPRVAVTVTATITEVREAQRGAVVTDRAT
jgi:hypothetical protein